MIQSHRTMVHCHHPPIVQPNADHPETLAFNVSQRSASILNRRNRRKQHRPPRTQHHPIQHNKPKSMFHYRRVCTHLSLTYFRRMQNSHGIFIEFFLSISDSKVDAFFINKETRRDSCHFHRIISPRNEVIIGQYLAIETGFIVDMIESTFFLCNLKLIVLAPVPY